MRYIKKKFNIDLEQTLKSGLTSFVILSAFMIGESLGAAVVQRGTTTARPSTASNVSAAARMPTVSATVNTATTQEETVVETTPVVEEAEPEAEPLIIENKSSQFDEILDETTSSSTSSSDNEMAELIRKQRAAYDAQDAASTASQSMQTALATGQNACDVALRKCMQEKCGNDFSKCSGDTDTTWGNKIDSCRLNTECTGEEYSMFAAEIKADRDMAAQLSQYNEIIDCGNRYNDCIITQCGTTFSKCLGKTAGDAAIKACETIAKNCTQQDSGLARRAMQVFGTLRQDAEVQVKADEERLYALRDQMRNQCQAMGAMFDDRSLDCVYTVEFYAGDDSTLYASKKAYAGNSFSCTPNWFGIDVTTFMENAYRLTRSETSATSAFMGAGLGVATGSITSGAIDRAIDRGKAEKALKDAENEGKEEEKAAEKAEKQAERKEQQEAKKAEREAKQQQKAAEREAKQQQKADQKAAATTLQTDSHTQSPVKEVPLNNEKSTTNNTYVSEKDKAAAIQNTTQSANDFINNLNSNLDITQVAQRNQ